MTIDNRRDLDRAYEKFGLPKLREGLCAICGHLTYNACEPGDPSASTMDWPKNRGVETVPTPSTIRFVSSKVAKTRGFYCTRGRLFATMLLSRRELRGFIAVKISGFTESGGSYETARGRPVRVTDTFVEEAFVQDVAAFKARQRQPVDVPWDDEPTEEEAWVSHWRRRSLMGGVRIAPQGRVLKRVILFDTAWCTPVIEEDTGD